MPRALLKRDVPPQRSGACPVLPLSPAGKDGLALEMPHHLWSWWSQAWKVPNFCSSVSFCFVFILKMGPFGLFIQLLGVLKNNNGQNVLPSIFFPFQFL